MTPLVVGLGDALRGDDGVGPAVVHKLREEGYAVAELVEVAAPLDLLASWVGRDVVVVDAVRTGRPPGTVVLLDPTPAMSVPEPLLEEALAPRGTFRAGSTHGLGLPEVLSLARSTDRLPARLRVVGVEAATFDLRAGLSSEVAAAVPAAARAVRDLLDA